MAHRTWMLGLWLGLVGFSVATGCVVKSDDDDGSDEGAAGEDTGGGGTTGGGTGGRGGSTGGGTGGATGGGTGGATGGGTGGATGGTSGTDGGGTGGATGGTSGTGGMEEEPECDPDEGNLVNTDYPNCEPSDPMDDCETCVETSCCTQSRVCYGYNPGNVCGYGGPLTGMYADLNEWDCYRFCAEIESDESGAYDDAVKETCAAECATVMCGLIGNATNELIECADTNCEEQCYTLEP